MGRSRAIQIAMLIVPAMLVTGGCANLRLPAIDPSGRSLFLPNPNYTTLARDGFLSRLHGGTGLAGLPRLSGAPGAEAAQLPGPYEPALLNRHREQLGQLFRNGANRLGGLHDGTRRLLTGLHENGGGLLRKHNGIFNQPGRTPATLFGNSAYPRVPVPPGCGPNGQAPAGSPCYPIGSPTDSSLAATLGRAGSGGLAGLNGSTGISRFAEVGPGVMIAQPRYTARVGDEIVILGGLLSNSGIARGGEAVKWSLSNDSVGTIIDAARPAQSPRRLFGFLHRTSARRGDAGCGSCVQSATSDRCRIVTRSRGNPNDDVYLSKGQSWVSLTSGSPGQSFVTLAAPQLSCGRRAATAIIDWTDATWECPKPVLTSLEKGELITKVYRNTDHSPLPNWNVRYTYIDGPKVTFNETGTSAANVSSDAKGRAILHVFPETTESGTTRIAIQIFDPDLPAQPVHQCIGYVTWSESEPAGGELTYPEEPAFAPAQEPAQIGPPDFGDSAPPRSDPANDPPIATPSFDEPAPQAQARPQIEIDVVEPPRQARIGERVEYKILVRNTGDGVAEDVIVSTIAPTAGVRFIRSNLQEQVFRGGQLVWKLGEIGPERSESILAEYMVTDAGSITNRFEANAINSVSDTAEVTTDLIGDVVSLEVFPPEPTRPQVGQEVVFDLQVSNRTSQPQPVQLVVQNWTGGLEPIVRGGEPANPVAGIQLGPGFQLPPGPSNRIPIAFRSVAPGTHTFDVVAVRPNSNEKLVQEVGTVRVVAPTAVPVGVASGKATLDPPSQMTAGSTQVVDVVVENDGDVALTNLTLIYEGDSDVAPSQGGTVSEPLLDELPPRRAVTGRIQIRANPTSPNGFGFIRIRVKTDQGDIEVNPFRIEILNADQSRRGIRVKRAGLEVSDPQLGSTATSTNSLRAEIETVPANVQAGEPFEFFMTVANDNRQGFRDLSLCLNLPEGVEILDFRGPPMTKTYVSKDGRHLDFGTVREILPAERLSYRAKAISKRPGRANVVARVEATGLIKPVIVGTSLNVR